ncbi:CBU_0592 family membrane protein [Mucilaginibacter sp.]
MKESDIIATTGVVILLIAFLLNLPANSTPYTLMNFIGAGLCGYSSYLIKFYPFVVLETIWALFALASLIKVSRGTSGNEQ